MAKKKSSTAGRKTGGKPAAVAKPAAAKATKPAPAKKAVAKQSPAKKAVAKKVPAKKSGKTPAVAAKKVSGVAKKPRASLPSAIQLSAALPDGGQPIEAAPLPRFEPAGPALEAIRQLPPELARMSVQVAMDHYADYLLSLPGVTGVSTGLKRTTTYQPGITDMPCLCIHVSEKRDLEAIPLEQRIAEHLDGVLTDIVVGKFGFSSAGASGPQVFGQMNITPTTLANGHGTLGVVMVDRNSQIRMLTNAHVIEGTRGLNTIDSGSPIDLANDAGQVIGTATVGQGINWLHNGEIDAALITPKPGVTFLNGIAPKWPQPKQVRALQLTDVNTLPVWRPDTASPIGMTFGRILSLDARFPLDDGLTTSNTMLIEADASLPSFGLPGHSGSLVFGGVGADGSATVVGLLRAVNKLDPHQALACRMDVIVDKLKLKFAVFQ